MYYWLQTIYVQSYNELVVYNLAAHHELSYNEQVVY